MEHSEGSPASGLDYELVKAAVREVLEGSANARITPRFEGGRMVLKPADSDQKPREIPIEDFFKKIVRLRDQLRVLEQRLNSHDKLTEVERSQMQGYITRCYGALTSFNVLFADKEDQFVGQRSR
jgi:hypothetical protein